jgi:Leucine-rich repeat (LRR) protein
MHKKLTQQLVRARTKIDNIALVKKFNLCGNDITDISIMNYMTNLEVVSLSVNKIQSLEHFSKLDKMKSLFLRENEISDIGEVFFL